jgi:hypothetical protein
LILLDAWLDSADPDLVSTDSGDDHPTSEKSGDNDVNGIYGEWDEHDWENVNYWAARLRPLWVKEGVEGGFAENGDLQDADGGQEEMVAVVCNRFGEENGKLIYLSLNTWYQLILQAKFFLVRRLC